MPRKPLDISKEILIEKYINQKQTLRQIGLSFNTNGQTIENHLKKHGIELRPPRNKKPTTWMSDLCVPEEYLYKRYVLDRLSINAIGRELGLHSHFVTQFLMKYNIPIRKITSYRYGFNEKFFETPNSLNSYWAGFIAADGCITDGSYQKKLQISLSRKDHNHLEILKKHISFTGPITEGYSIIKSKVLTKKYLKSSILITSDKICDDLFVNFSITPRKSLTLQPPNLIDDNCILSFICGYIDGDGCIHLRKNNGHLYLNLSILGTYEMLDWIKGNLKRILQYEKTINIYKQKRNKYYSLKISDKYIPRALYEYFLKLSLPFLDRKWNKVRDFKTTPRIFNSKYEYNDKKQSLKKWAKEYNMTPGMLASRIRRGWSLEKALITPKLDNYLVAKKKAMVIADDNDGSDNGDNGQRH